MSRSVRGSFFAEYVRMIRRIKSVQWESILPPEDLVFIHEHVVSDQWYPMATFERLGVAILHHLPGATLESVRAWGRYSASLFSVQHPNLIAPNDPVESLMRLKVLRSTLFDFPAFDIPTLLENEARISLSYHMGPIAEEAACFQTMGFCEGIVSLSGGAQIEADFQERSWSGDPRTIVSMQWILEPL